MAPEVTSTLSWKQFTWPDYDRTTTEDPFAYLNIKLPSWMNKGDSMFDNERKRPTNTMDMYSFNSHRDMTEDPLAAVRKQLADIYENGSLKMNK